MTAQLVIALLGRRDEPTDAVEEYSRCLGQALQAQNFAIEIRRVPWNEHGWAAALEVLQLQAKAWRGTWVLLQYTALAWSERGFPRRFLRVLRILRKSGARIAVVFHDAEPFGGSRLIDRLRRAAQIRVMRSAVAFSDCAVFTVVPGKLSWVGGSAANSRFIPVGANLPFPLAPQQHDVLHSPPTIAVFSITGGPAGDRETRNIVAAVRFAAEKLGKLHLLVFGRHAEAREEALRAGLSDLPVKLNVCGVIEGAELIERFRDSDVLLFVRGAISSRRSSAISGIACGLPVIALEGTETAPPITGSGVVLVPENLDEAKLQSNLGQALVRVLSETGLRVELVRRSQNAQEKYFSWPAIARQYAELLKESD